MKALHLAAAAAALVALSACTEESPATPAADQPAETSPAVSAIPAPPTVDATINWQAARDAAAQRPGDVVIPQAVGDGPLLVPMLLPGGIVQTQSDRPTPPRITKAGYFATYHLPRYDVIVTGSQKAIVTGGEAAADKETPKFEQIEAGARLVFSRFGASYEVAFECRQVDGPEGCITEAEAKEFADSLFVAQSQ
jgi:hypothetical protein